MSREEFWLMIDRSRFESCEVRDMVYTSKPELLLEARLCGGRSIRLEARTWDDLLNMLPEWAKKSVSTERV